MARVPELQQLVQQTLPDGRTVGEAAYVVHVYTVEAHPALPDPTPYKQWTDDELPNDPTGGTAYGDVGQAYDLEERATNARRVLPEIPAGAIQLLDDVAPGPLDNPVWCTYGTAPNPAFLISQEGEIVFAQLWTEVASLRQALVDQIERVR